MKKVFLILWILLGNLHLLLAQGILEGTVTDKDTKEPVIGASISIEQLKVGILSDEEGRFLLKNLTPGTYQVSVKSIGYKTEIRYEVLIQGGVNQIRFELEASGKELEGVEIVASPFTRTEENPISIKTIGIEQIRSNPGGNFDISKVVQALPGVSGALGFRNDIIVRGGAPNENVYYLDGVETPIINHFSTQGAAGGPVGMINALFIQNVDLQSSAFGSKFDNALSSVLDFKMISGNSEKIQTQIQVGASEAGLVLDGPIGKKTTFLVSARRSYLQFLFKLIELPFLPEYWDFQTKIEHKIDDKSKLTFIGIGSIDNFVLNKPEDTSPENLYILDNIPDNAQWSYTNGLNYSRLTKNGYFSLIASRNMLNNSAEKYDDNETGNMDKLRFNFVSREIENKLRLNIVTNTGSWKIGYGASVQYVKYSNTTFNRFTIATADTAIQDTIRVNTNLDFFKYGAYVNFSRRLLEKRLGISFGFRTDMNSFTKNGNNPIETFSPRVAVGYNLTDKISINGSWGIYYKIPPYTILGFTDNGPEYLNQSAKYIGSQHLAAGFSFQPENATIFSIEGFYKWYWNYPVSVRDGISLANQGADFGVIGNEEIVSVGEGRTYGVETFIQKKLTKRIFGIASLTLFRSEFSGLNKDTFIRSSWDTRVLVSITGGYKFGKNWEVSGKVRYLGPAPYTPYDIDASVQAYPFTGTGVPDYSMLNSAQTNGFLQVDGRLDKKIYFKKLSLNFYLDIQNLTNRANLSAPAFTLKRNADNTGFETDPNTGNGIPVLIEQSQTSLLPTIGIIVRF